MRLDGVSAVRHVASQCTTCDATVLLRLSHCESREGLAHPRAVLEQSSRIPQPSRIQMTRENSTADPRSVLVTCRTSWSATPDLLLSDDPQPLGYPNGQRAQSTLAATRADRPVRP